MDPETGALVFIRRLERAFEQTVSLGFLWRGDGVTLREGETLSALIPGLEEGDTADTAPFVRNRVNCRPPLVSGTLECEAVIADEIAEFENLLGLDTP